MVQKNARASMILNNQSGMAVLITVMTVSLLVAVTVMFHRTTWHSYLVANNYKVGTQLKAIGASGLNIGLALLTLDIQGNSYDSLQESWATLTKEELADLFVNGDLELEILDLSGRLQVNSLVQQTQPGTTAGEEGKEQEKDNGTEPETGEEKDKESGKEDGGEQANTEKELRDALLQLLLLGSFELEEESEAQAIVDALVDWIDTDERESDNGAESSYYQGLKKPYECRNGPIRYIEELLLVKGITPELLFGDGEEKGLGDYLTVYGDDGKININTADTLLIKSLNPVIGDELLEKLQEYRQDEENQEQLVSATWYTRIASWPGDIVLDAKLLTTESKFFLIRSTGRSDTIFRRMSAVVHRVDEKDIQVLSRKVQ